MSWTPEESDAREALTEAGRRLARFNPGHAGNFSLRLSCGDVLITPAGADKGRLTPPDMVRVRATGEPVREGERALSSETGIHLAAYAASRRVGAAVHAHPQAATVVGLMVAGENLNLSAEAAALLGPVVRVGYRRPGTPPLARAAGAASARSVSILLAQHGAFTLGATLEEAVARMETFEHVCGVFLEARAQGCARALPAGEVRELRALFGHDAGAPLEIFEV